MSRLLVNILSSSCIVSHLTISKDCLHLKISLISTRKLFLVYLLMKRGAGASGMLSPTKMTTNTTSVKRNSCLMVRLQATSSCFSSSSLLHTGTALWMTTTIWTTPIPRERSGLKRWGPQALPEEPRRSGKAILVPRFHSPRIKNLMTRTSTYWITTATAGLYSMDPWTMLQVPMMRIMNRATAMSSLTFK
jgi:hypothetical protein